MFEKCCMIFLLYLVYSFLGWLLEVIITFYSINKFVNRGFLIGPYCPIYGTGSLLIIILLKKYENDIVALFTMSFVICSIIEYISSFLMEKLFNTRWWDYSERKFNLNGRVCLDNLIAFGALGVILMRFVNPVIINFLNSISSNIIYIITITLFIGFIIDYIISFKIIIRFKAISNNTRTDSTEKVTNFVKKEMAKKNKILYNRIIHAFPGLKIYKRK